MRNHDYWVYILTNKHGTTLYIGITNNITRRLFQHRYGERDGFAKRYHLTRLVWLEHFRNVNDAIACEKKLKGWRRSRKIALIEEMNPRWLDLSDDWEQQPKFCDRPWQTEASEMESLASPRKAFGAALQLRFAQNDIG
jgi:putative endonuclease